MIRFWRIVLLCFGIFSLLGATIKTLQPAETDQSFMLIYADYHGTICCSAFLINETRRMANRVDLGTFQQADLADRVSPDGRWRWANVRTPTGYTLYLLRNDIDAPPLRMPESVTRIYEIYWGEPDVLYYLAAPLGGYELALFRLKPDDPQPILLTDYQFEPGRVRSVQEYRLDHSLSWSPWLGYLLAFSALIAGLGWRPSNAKLKPIN